MTNIAVFASGRGSNFRSVHAKILCGQIPARVSLLICDNPRAGAIDYAREQDIPVAVIAPRNFPDAEAFGNEIIRVLTESQAGLVVLAGYLKKIPDNVIESYRNKILNVHPALLPAFGGKGMYGMNVHHAVFNAGVQVSGVTVHFVTTEYDAGPIILQKAVDISDCHTAEEIAGKVLAVEHQVLPEAVRLLTENEIAVEGQRVRIMGNIHDPH